MALNINANELKNVQLQHGTDSIQSGSSRMQLSLSETKGEDKKNAAGSLEISREGLLRTLRSTEPPTKTAGVTSAREQWENDNLRTKNSSNGSVHVNEFDLFRLNDPDGYAKMKALEQKAFESCHIKREISFLKNKISMPEGGSNKDKKAVSYLEDGKIIVESGKIKNVSFHLDENDETMFSKKTYWEEDQSEAAQKEAMKYTNEAFKVFNDWRADKCIINGKIVGAAGRNMSTVEQLENRYSTGGHDLSVNFYAPGEDDHPSSIYTGASMWRFSTKFNLLLPTDMIHTLTYGDKQERESLMGRIDQYVQQMKDVEKQYAGNHTYLRFGVKLYSDGSATFHANHSGCDDPYGISADSAKKLLSML